MKKALITLFFLCIFYVSNAQLNGSYTINPSAAASKTNYKNFASAVGDMASGSRTDGGATNGKGVSGPVVFSVAAGTFSEQVIIPKIKGASATNSITFDGGAGNAATRVITYAATSHFSVATVLLSNASYIRLRNLTINATGATYACSVQVLDSTGSTDTVKSVIIKHCTLNVPNSSTSAYFINLLIDGSPDIDTINYCLKFQSGYFDIMGGTIIGMELDSSYLNYGNYALFDVGNQTIQDSGHIFLNDTFKPVNNATAFNYGVYNGAEFYGLNGLVLQHSSLSWLKNGVLADIGIEIRYCSNTSGVSGIPRRPVIINANQLCGAQQVGIDMYGMGYNNAVVCYITNNFIGGGWSDAYAKGFNINFCGDMNIWNNTINMDTTTTGNGIIIANNSGTYGNYDIRNNIIAFTRNVNTWDINIPIYDLSVYAYDTLAVDYDDIYNGGLDTLLNLNSIIYNNSTFKGGGGYNYNSFNENPGFMGDTDLRITNYALPGVNIPYIKTDIFGNPRHNPPSMGAFEVTPNSVTITSPIDTVYAPSQNVKIAFKVQHAFNKGNIFSIELSDSNGNFAKPVVLATLKDTIGDSTTVTLPAILNIGSGYRFRVAGSNPAINGLSTAFRRDVPLLTISSPIDSAYLPSQNILLAFKVVNAFNTGNNFSIQLSDGFGNFTNAVTLASIKDTAGDSVKVNLPGVLPPGCNYRFRIVATSPNIISASSTPFSIYSLTSPPGDYALKFDGKSGWVDLGTWFNQDSFTISFWANPDSVQEGGAAVLDIQNNLIFYSNPFKKGNYILSHGLQQDLFTNSWQYITITMDVKSSIRKLYIFGQLVDSNYYPYSAQNGFDMRLGNAGIYGNPATANSYWKGMIDEVKIYKRILSNGEILQGMNKELQGNEPGLLAYWNFNDVQCDTVSHDKASNHFPAILENSGVVKVPSTVPNIGQQVIPNFGGNLNIVMVSIYGAGFQQGATVKFTKTGFPDVVADSVTISKDGSTALVRFELKGADTGLYNVVLTDTNNFVYTYPNSFTIQPGGKPNVWFQMLGKDVLRISEPYTVLIEYGNKGNESARAVPFGFAVTDTNTQVQMMFNAMDTVKNDTALYTKVDTLFKQPFAGRLYSFIIPVIPPGGTGVIGFRIKESPNFKGTFDIKAWVDSPLYQSPLNLAAFNCASNVIGAVLDNPYIPSEIACATGALNGSLAFLVNSAFGKLVSWDEEIANLENVVLQAEIGCIPGGTQTAKDLAGIIATNTAAALAGGGALGTDVHSAVCNCSEWLGGDEAGCKPKPKPNTPPGGPPPGGGPQDMSPNPIAPYDPNFKTGPAKYQNLSGPFSYMIGFENKATATGAAQQVVVIDTLDKSKFNLSTFSFGTIGWGDSIYFPTHPLQKSFSMDYNYKTVDSLIVRVQARLDSTSGVLRWQFSSLDTTLQPTQNALAGFLPPNKTSPQGEGFVSYTITPKVGLPTGTQINNGATIYFDYNTPIATQVHNNYIDIVSPLSAVNPPKQMNDSAVNLSWSGTDMGSGIEYYNIFYNDNNGNWQLLLYKTDSLKVTFYGQPGHTYSFFSLATDSAGNKETDTLPIRTVTLTTTSMAFATKRLFELKSIPNPFSQECTIEFSLPESMNINLTVHDLYGNTVTSVAKGEFMDGHYAYNFKSANLTAGVYIIELSTDKGTYYNKMMIEK